jgi:hypothetical protein
MGASGLGQSFIGIQRCEAGVYSRLICQVKELALRFGSKENEFVPAEIEWSDTLFTVAGFGTGFWAMAQPATAKLPSKTMLTRDMVFFPTPRIGRYNLLLCS